MRPLIFALSLLFVSVTGFSQGFDLQFSRVLTVSASPQTVPANKVWKVMSVYGKANDQCTLDPLNIWSGGVNEYWKYKAKGFQVNGATVWMQISETTFDIKQCNDCNCSNYTTRAWTTTDAVSFRNDVGHQTADDLQSILPFWLEAGATLNSLHTDQKISVMEFNLVP
jgi:hypothetical protein